MTRSPRPPFAETVSDAMARRGMTLRGLCRAAGLDPSFVSKVLAGKRSPPSDEGVLRRVAGALGLEPASLIVSAGLIPSEWGALWRDRALFEGVHALATRTRGPARPSAVPRPPSTRPAAPVRDSARGPSPARPGELAEELL